MCVGVTKLLAERHRQSAVSYENTAVKRWAFAGVHKPAGFNRTAAMHTHCWSPMSSHPDGGCRNHMGVAHSYCNELLIRYTPWSAVRAGQLCVLVSCACWSAVCAGRLCVLVGCACWSAVRAGQLCVLVSCACWSAVRAGQTCANPAYIQHATTVLACCQWFYCMHQLMNDT